MFAAKTFRRFATATAPRSSTFAARQFQTSTRLAFPRKDAQDKDSLKPESNEYSKSGSDQASAQSDAAFDPSTTKPESEGSEAAQDAGSSSNSSLDVSPANHDVSQPKQGDQDAGSPQQTGQGPSDRKPTSGGGSPKKSG